MSKEKESLIERLQKKTTIKSSIIDDSDFFKDPDFVNLPVPMMNVALSGSFDKGLAHGLIQIAGPSKHFKSSYGLLMVKSYMDHHKDATCVFFDNEWGSPKDYFESFGIDTARVLHCPFKDIEQLKFDCVAQLEELTEKDNVIFFIDSIGNAASKKELQDAIDRNTAADMSRAKAIKSFFRIVTPYLNLNKIPMVAINHTYSTQDRYAKQIVSGGTGGYYSSNAIWVVGRAKNGSDDISIEAFDFKIKIEKSRYVREGAVIPITVSYQNGINKWSGLFEVAQHLGYIKSEKKGWFTAYGDDGNKLVDKSYRRNDTNDAEFWNMIFEKTEFKKKVEKMYSLSNRKMIQESNQDIDESIEMLKEEIENEK